MTAIILFILLLLVVYVYATDTFHHLFHALQVTARMMLLLLGMFLILGLLIYSFVKFGNILGG